MSKPRRQHLLALLVSLTALITACDAARELIDKDEVERRLRDDPDRPAKGAAILALGVRARAIATAREASQLPHPDCARPSPPYRQSLQLDVALSRDGAPLTRQWTQTITLLRDASGDVRIEDRVSYVQETAQRGERVTVWTSIGDEVFIGPSDARLVRHKEPSPAHRARFIARHEEILQVMLSLVGGWTRLDGESRWPVRFAAGQEPIRCGGLLGDDELRWWSRWRARGTVSEASLVFEDARSRELSARWELVDGGVMQVRVKERVEEDGAIDVVAPRADAILSSTGESWADIDAALDELDAMGVLEPVAEPDQAREESDE